MKRNLKGKLLIVVLTSFLLAACVRDEHAHQTTYTCPMHPTVVADQPGTCPVCGMDLVPKTRPGEEVEITQELSRLLHSSNEVVVGNIKTLKGEYKSVPLTVHAPGVVTYDTRKIFTIPARVAGRLEEVYVKYPFQRVAKGARIARIYSPELVTAQRELVFLLEQDAQNTTLIDAAKKKLRLLGMTEGQISQAIKRKEAGTTVDVYSPYAGFVVTGQQASTESLIREGDYVIAGQTMFTIVNNDALRIELDIPATNSAWIKLGDTVQLKLGTDGETAVATVDFVQPFIGDQQNFMKIRVYTSNIEGLHIGHLVNAEIYVNPAEGLWVPEESVLTLGIQKVVFLKDRDVFKPKTVTTGNAADGLIEITTGLASSDEIAANAHFLVDSESLIKPIE